VTHHTIFFFFFFFLKKIRIFCEFLTPSLGFNKKNFKDKNTKLRVFELRRGDCKNNESLEWLSEVSPLFFMCIFLFYLGESHLLHLIPSLSCSFILSAIMVPIESVESKFRIQNYLGHVIYKGSIKQNMKNRYKEWHINFF
jgi:hypothetical protein